MKGRETQEESGIALFKSGDEREGLNGTFREVHGKRMRLQSVRKERQGKDSVEE